MRVRSRASSVRRLLGRALFTSYCSLNLDLQFLHLNSLFITSLISISNKYIHFLKKELWMQSDHTWINLFRLLHHCNNTSTLSMVWPFVILIASTKYPGISPQNSRHIFSLLNSAATARSLLAIACGGFLSWLDQWLLLILMLCVWITCHKLL